MQSDHVSTESTYEVANIPLTDDKRIQFLSEDVIGFYNPPDTRYTIQVKTTMGYKFYVFVGSNASSFDLRTATGTPTNRQSFYPVYSW